MPGITLTVMSRAALEAMANAHGFRVETMATKLPETDPPRAYWLYGPRGNKHFLVAVDGEGGVDCDEVKLWWDGVEYATRRVAAKRAAKAAGKRYG
jgi:hypothetical protein